MCQSLIGEFAKSWWNAKEKKLHWYDLDNGYSNLF